MRFNLLCRTPAQKDFHFSQGYGIRFHNKGSNTYNIYYRSNKRKTLFHTYRCNVNAIHDTTAQEPQAIKQKSRVNPLDQYNLRPMPVQFIPHKNQKTASNPIKRQKTQ